MVKMSLVLTTAAAVAGAAFHAELKSSMPAKGSTVSTPAMVSLTFTEGVTPALSKIAVLEAADSSVVQQLMPKAAGAATIEGTLSKPLAAGKYVIRWRAAAADDGHTTNGVFGFTVK